MVWIFLGIFISSLLMVLIYYTNRSKISGGKLKLKMLLGVFGMLAILPGFITKVPAVEEGIIYDPFNGGVQEETLGEGYHTKSLFSNVYSITKSQQSLSYGYGSSGGSGGTFAVQTKNSEYARYAVEIKYSVTDASIVFATWKGLPTENDLSQYVQGAIKSTAVNYTIYEILGSEFENSRVAAENALIEDFAEFGLSLISLNYVDIDAGEEIENTIVRQGTSAKEEEINVNLQNAAIIAAETARVEAEGIANAAIEKATGEAAAIKLQADAEAYAIEAVADAEQELMTLLGLSPEQYIDYIKWSEWNGVLPTTMLSDGTEIIIDPAG